MQDPIRLKAELIQKFHGELGPAVARIEASDESHQEKAKAVNAYVEAAKKPLSERLLKIAEPQDRQAALLVLAYCASVVSLEYRHRVWPYEYMAFSRRVGELWERFCSAAWDCPSRPRVDRITEPEFSQVYASIRGRVLENAKGSRGFKQIEEDLGHLLTLIGEINMKEDEVFEVEGRPHVVDFKSGFGSNEKGNTSRLLAVGRAYRLWKPETTLLLLVRQEENNHYLEIIRKSRLWEVHCGDAAYAKIDELTGANTKGIRRKIINFEADLSPEFQKDIRGHLSDLTAYLRW